MGKKIIGFITRIFLVLIIILIASGCSIKNILKDSTESDISTISNDKYIMDSVNSYDEDGHYKGKNYFLYNNKTEEVLLNNILYYKIDSKNNSMYFIFYDKTIEHDQESLFILNYVSGDYKIINNVNNIKGNLRKKIDKENMIKP